MKSVAAIGQQAPLAAAAVGRTVGDYRLPAKVMHWITVALVFFMVASGVIAMQLGDGRAAELLLGLHKLTGVATLAVVLLRVGYRLLVGAPKVERSDRSRSVLHWTLYGIVILVPLLGWAGASDYNSLTTVFGLTLPAIVPHESGYGPLLLALHAYIAFALLAMVALHIGAAMHDYMRDPSTSEQQK